MPPQSHEAEPDTPVYESDPRAPDDGGFEPGTLGHLVAGNQARMLDPRRTPVTVLGTDASRGEFEVEVGAFEDTGARWRLPVEDVSRFQFHLESPHLPDAEVHELEQLVARLSGRIRIPVEVEARERTLVDITAERGRLRPLLLDQAGLEEIELERCVRERTGSAEAAAALEVLLGAAGLGDLERSLSRTYVSNPNSGEVVKGHAIVIAEMGLCPYAGKAVRDEQLFEGDGSKDNRRRHILLRLAFLQELTALLGIAAVELYRGVALMSAVEAPRPSSLAATTFSREVATSHFDSHTPAALLARQRVPVSRLFMTFLETAAMNDRYREAEAVLIGDPSNPVF
jgi:hypothetical protein